jgi:hypothetical protein
MKEYMDDFKAFARDVLGLEVPASELALLERLGPAAVRAHRVAPAQVAVNRDHAPNLKRLAD